MLNFEVNFDIEDVAADFENTEEEDFDVAEEEEIDNDTPDIKFIQETILFTYYIQDYCERNDLDPEDTSTVVNVVSTFMYEENFDTFYANWNIFKEENIELVDRNTIEELFENATGGVSIEDYTKNFNSTIDNISLQDIDLDLDFNIAFTAD